MGLFPSANDFKAGKGVEKDAPRKTGTGKGFGGDIVATLTVESDGTVSDCKLEGASETESIGGAALEELAKQVVAANGAEIDGVSGATLTTNGVKDAVTAALAE